MTSVRRYPWVTRDALSQLHKRISCCRRMNTAILRTHGGLGNQIFQVLYGRLYAAKHQATVLEIYDARYRQPFPRSTELARFPACTSRVARALSALRIPKVLRRVGISRQERVRLGETVLLDGYFQSVAAYQEFSPAEVAHNIEVLRGELRTSRAHVSSGVLYHVRLGDFFVSLQNARKHAASRVKAMLPHSTIVTNQEELFAEPALRTMLEAKRCIVRPTKGLSAESVLRVMSEYEEIVANDSTLSLWAAILGHSKISIQLKMLRDMHDYLRACDQANLTGEHGP